MHPLQQRIADLRSRVRRLSALYAAGRATAVALAAVLVAGGADYLLRFHDRGIRVIVSAAVAAACAWACYRYGCRLLAARLRDSELANCLQRRFPQLDDGLASAVEFLRQSDDDPLSGSAALRRVVIAQATARTQSLDFAAVLDARGAIRGAALAAVLCLAAAGLAALNPSACGLALARLANPLGQRAWPRENHLALRDRVERVARGETFEVEAVDAAGAALPPDVRIHYRFESADGPGTRETLPMRPLGGAAVARRENVTRSFSYRIEGGDDHSQPWIAVAVVDPPTIDAISLRLVPPEYTSWPPYEAERPTRALVGTRLEFRGTTNRPIASAALCFQDGRSVPATLDDDRHFHVAGADAALVVEKSESCWFALTDHQGLTSQEHDRWEIRAVHDAPPSVAIEQPAANLFVTPRAVVAMRIAANDDLAVHNVELLVSRAGKGQGGPLRLPVYTGPDKATPPPPGFTGTPPGDNRLIPYRLDLAALDLRPGTELTVRATAADYRPGTGTSEPRRISVISVEELNERLAVQADLILTELARALKMQQEGRTQVAALAVRLAEAGALAQLDVDHLQAAALGQRQVDHLLTSRQDGLPAAIQALLDDIATNGVESPDAPRRMKEISAVLTRLGAGPLPAIAQRLTAAIKAAQVQLEAAEPKRAADPLLSAALAGAGTSQDEVIAELQKLLAALVPWDNYRRFYREVAQLLREEEILQHRTAALARDTLGREPKDLLPQQLADLRGIGDGQLELALRLDQVEEEMRLAAVALREPDPAAAGRLADAVATAGSLAIGGQMRLARTATERNQLGQAVGAEKRAVAGLQTVLEILAGRQDSSGDQQSATSNGREKPSQPKDGNTTGDHQGVKPNQPGGPKSPKQSGGQTKPPGATPGQGAGDKGAHPAAPLGPAEIRRMLTNLPEWGNLPPKDREKMLQRPAEEFLPKYRAMLEEYYQRLAEPKEKQP